MLGRRLNNGFDDLIQIHIFKSRLQQQQPKLLDVIDGSSFMYESLEDAITIIERITLSDHHGQYNRGPTYNKSGIIELNVSETFQ